MRKMRKPSFILLILNSSLIYSQNYSIKGQVIDSISNNPIAFANILLTVDTAIIEGTFSDTLGKFMIDNISSKIVTISAQMLGYSEKNIEINLKSTNNYTLIKLLSYSDSPPDKYMVYQNDTIYFNSKANESGWTLTCVDCPSIKQCNGKPCNGLIKTYFINGQIEEIAFFKNGKIISGEYLCYYENGQLERKGEYLNENRVNQWVFYNKFGIIESIANYDSLGNIKTIIEFSENGELIEYEQKSDKTLIFINFKQNGMIDNYYIKKNNFKKEYKFNNNGLIE